MATRRQRVKNYAKDRYSGARSRATNYGKRAYSYSKGFDGGIKLNFSTAFAVGLLVGFTDIDSKIPPAIKLGVSCAPLRGGPVGLLKAGAQGMVFGDMLSGLTGLSIPVLGLPATNINAGSLSYY